MKNYVKNQREVENIMFLKSIRNLIRGYGYDLVKYNPGCNPIARRVKLISQYKIDLVFDVGANTGQYATKLRGLGYRGRMVSFEPLTSAYKSLVSCASKDPLWETVNVALGNKDGKAEINIAGNSQSSSILDMLPSHTITAPDSAYVGKEEITIRKIDSIVDEYRRPENKLYLKIDAQGYEKTIIQGAENSLNKIIGIQLEASLIPLYRGEALLSDMIDFMSTKGYTLMSLEPGYGDPSTGQLLQVDCIFFPQNTG